MPSKDKQAEFTAWCVKNVAVGEKCPTEACFDAPVSENARAGCLIVFLNL